MERFEKTVAFKVSKINFNRSLKLPRSFKISDKLREAYEKILNEAGV